MSCTRCAGFLGRTWDTSIREYEIRCWNCGHRPAVVTVRADGQEKDAPMMCVDCKVKPRVFAPMKTVKGETEVQRCAACRQVYNKRTREQKRQRTLKLRRAANGIRVAV